MTEFPSAPRRPATHTRAWRCPTRSGHAGSHGAPPARGPAPGRRRGRTSRPTRRPSHVRSSARGAGAPTARAASKCCPTCSTAAPAPSSSGSARRRQRLPLTIALRHDDDGIAVDAVLLTEDAVSIVFSFTRAYFHVDDEEPAAMVAFLREIMPSKPRNELYTALGFFKHGKTLLYRDLARHIATSDDRFVFAPGHQGHGHGRLRAAQRRRRVQGHPRRVRAAQDDDPAGRHGALRAGVQARSRGPARGCAGVRAPRVSARSFRSRSCSPSCGRPADRSCTSTATPSRFATSTPSAGSCRSTSSSRAADRASAVDAIIDWGQSIKDLAATEHLPRRPAAQELRRDEARAGGLLRLRRAVPAVGVPVPAHARRRATTRTTFGARAVVPRRRERHLPRGVPDVPRPPRRPEAGRSWRPTGTCSAWSSGRRMQARHAAGEVVDILPYRESQRLRRTP